MWIVWEHSKLNWKRSPYFTHIVNFTFPLQTVFWLSKRTQLNYCHAELSTPLAKWLKITMWGGFSSQTTFKLFSSYHWAYRKACKAVAGLLPTEFSMIKREIRLIHLTLESHSLSPSHWQWFVWQCFRTQDVIITLLWYFMFSASDDVCIIKVITIIFEKLHNTLFSTKDFGFYCNILVSYNKWQQCAYLL